MTMNSLRHPNDRDSHNERLKVSVHVRSAVHFARRVLLGYYRSLGRSLRMSARKQSDLLNRIGVYLMDEARYEEAAEAFNEAISLLEAQCNSTPEALEALLWNLATVRHRQGLLAEAAVQ